MRARLLLVVAAVRRVIAGSRGIAPIAEVDDLADMLARAAVARDRNATGQRESEARYRATFEQAAVGMAHVGLDGRWLRVNARLCEMLGYTAPQLMAKTFQDITHPDDLDADLAQVDRIVAGEVATYAMEKRYLRRDGSVLWGNLRVSLLRGPDGQPGHLIAVVEDISRGKQAEEALRASQRRLEDLVRTLDLAAVLVRDFDGAIRFWSEGCERLYGWTAGQALGSVSDDLLRTVFDVPLAEIEAALLRDGTWSGDLVQHRRDGTRIVVSARKVLRRNPDAGGLTVMESLADVTALRLAQTELERLNRELGQRVREEVVAREAAQARAAHAERVQALGQLAGGIAHDFNNVLQAVQGGAALIERRSGDADTVRRYARLVLDASGRGASITRRLLAFGRRGDLRAEAVDAGAVLSGMRDIMAHTLGAGIAVGVDLAPGLPPVMADKAQLETALVNLATNARDAMPDGGTLTFAAAFESVPPGANHASGLPGGGYVRLSVTDTGAGMDRSTLARVFEPFFTTKGRGEGTGLGLAMAKGFAEQSGGGLALESAPGRGTTVNLWLPKAGAGADASESPIDAAGCGPDEAGPGPRRVLLVDDDPLVRETLAMQMESEGYDVLTAEGGTAALALLAAGEAVDVLVTDLSMPGMDGVAVIRAARDRVPNLPAVLLTGYAGDRVASDLNATFALMRKPISGVNLADRIATLLTAA